MITLIALINLSCILLWAKYLHDKRVGNNWFKYPFPRPDVYLVALILTTVLVSFELIILAIVYLP